MLVVVLSGDDRLRRRLVETLSGIHVVAARGWCPDDLDPDLVDCVINTGVSWHLVRGTVDALSPTSSIPVVQLRDRGTQLTELSGPYPGSQLWLDSTRDDLRVAVMRASATRFFRRLADCWLSENRLAPSLSRAIQIACEGNSRVTTIKELAQTVQRSPRTMQHHWQHFVNNGPQPNAKLQMVVWWLLVLRAIANRNCGIPWRDLATSVGVHPHTMARVVTRATNAPMAHLRFMRGDDVVERYIRYCTDLGMDTRKFQTLLGNCALSGSFPQAVTHPTRRWP